MSEDKLIQIVRHDPDKDPLGRGLRGGHLRGVCTQAVHEFCNESY